MSGPVDSLSISHLVLLLLHFITFKRHVYAHLLYKNTAGSNLMVMILF